MGKIISRVFFGFFVLFVLSAPSFAAMLAGVGGDAEFFPKDWFIVSAITVPTYYLENVSGSMIYGVEGIVGSNDLSLALSVGKQSSNDFNRMGIRKKIWGSENSLCALTLLFDVDSINNADLGTTMRDTYIGVVVSNKYYNVFNPYIAILSTGYSIRTRNIEQYQSINGIGLAGGLRYDYDAHWSGRAEVDYNALSTTNIVPMPKSVMSLSMAVSYTK